jgi:hypothetical protein
MLLKKSLMIFNKAYKTDSHRYSKIHLAENGSSISLCGRKQIEVSNAQVKIINRKWYKEDINSGELTSVISEYDIRNTFCRYCEATAHCKERDGSHAA